MVAGTTYLPPLPVGPLAADAKGADACDGDPPARTEGRPKPTKLGLTQPHVLSTSWSSIARIVNKTEARRKREARALRATKPAVAHTHVRLLLKSEEMAPMRTSSSTPSLPQLVLDAVHAQNQASTSSESATAEAGKPQGADHLETDQPVDAGCEAKEASEDTEVVPQDAELVPTESILVAPWKRSLSKKGTKTFKRCESHLIFEPKQDEEDVQPDGQASAPEDVLEQSGDVDASLAPAAPAPSDAGAHSSTRSSASLGSDSADISFNLGTGTRSVTRRWSKAKQAARLAATLRPESMSMLDTAQQWRRWCRKTDQVFDAMPQTSSWRGAEATAKSIRDLDTELSLDKDRLRLMIQQGVHKSKNGLKLTVRHVQTDIDRETLWRNRRETLEKVDTHGKRIQQALQDSLRARKDLQSCVQLLKETVTEKTDKVKKKPRVTSKERKRSWSSGRLDDIKKKLEEFIRTGDVDDYEEEEQAALE